MENVRRKAGWLLAALGALACSAALQYLCAQLWFSGIRLYEQARLAAQGVTDAGTITGAAAALYDRQALWVVLSYHAAGIFLFGACYRRLCKNDCRKPLGQVVTVKKICVLLATGVALQFFFSCVLQTVNLLAPSVLREYAQMLEGVGLYEINALTLMITGVAAPIGEELLCRGVILHCAQKATGRFWAANLIQAAAFGIMHMNLVQGLYAFAMGLVLGAFCRWHASVCSSIVLHAVINVSGMLLVDAVLGHAPETIAWYLPLCVLFAAVCAGGLWLGARTGRTDKNTK